MTRTSGEYPTLADAELAKARSRFVLVSLSIKAIAERVLPCNGMRRLIAMCKLTRLDVMG
ncbi:MAG: hypothetical protein ACAF41_04300 [Leptolyngbya sp. BL-A-14]